MNIGDKLRSLRKKKGYSQEQLAEYLSVSRQSISKWEQDIAYPETDKLIKLAKFYNISIDSMIDPNYKEDKNPEVYYLIKKRHYQYKSKTTLFGLPLVHINLGNGLYVSKGIISIGTISLGVISLGLFSVGLISVGLIALGILLALGTISFGSIAVGSIAVGLFTIGALSIGLFSVGALSIGKFVAIGDEAIGFIAIGKTKASGTYTYIDAYNEEGVIDLIKNEIPHRWSLFIEWIKLFL